MDATPGSGRAFAARRRLSIGSAPPRYLCRAIQWSPPSPAARAPRLARRRLNSFLLDLKSKPTEKWPPHLRRAWNILRSESELALSEETALSLIIKSVPAAHKCGQAINQKSVDIAEFQPRIKLHDTLRRIAKCAKRAPTCRGSLRVGSVRPVSAVARRCGPAGGRSACASSEIRGSLWRRCP